VSGAPLGRRTFLTGAATAAGAIFAVSCGGPSARGTRFPLADLPVGGRRKVFVKGRPVEVRRTEAGVVARSLLCTHTGCTVVWDDGLKRYLCPCHQGVFDADGAVVAGAPTLNLPGVPAAVEGTDVVVGGAP